MTIGDFIKNTNLEKSLLIGYYGGGNYGDELLLEVLMNLLSKKGVKNADVAYMPYCDFSTYHHDFGYQPFQANSIPKLIGAMARNKNIIVGGGGIWGLDAKLQPLLMSIALFIGRWIFGCNVYLVGVGYYKSTNWYGHFGAWLAAKASNAVIGRDTETMQNFSKFQPKTYKDKDIAWYLKDIDISSYQTDLDKLEQTIQVNGKTLFITLRRFSAKHQNNFTDVIGHVIEASKGKNIIVAILEPAGLDTESYSIIKSWQEKYKNVKAIDFSYNPLALYLFLQKHSKNLTLISPQFHAIISAYLHKVPFMPLVYDNKVSELFDQIGTDQRISLYDVRSADVHEYLRNQESVQA